MNKLRTLWRQAKIEHYKRQLAAMGASYAVSMPPRNLTPTVVYSGSDIAKGTACYVNQGVIYPIASQSEGEG